VYTYFGNSSTVTWKSTVFVNIERVEVSIRRGHIAEDGYDKLSGVNLRVPIAITFIDQFGKAE